MSLLWPQIRFFTANASFQVWLKTWSGKVAVWSGIVAVWSGITPFRLRGFVPEEQQSEKCLETQKSVVCLKKQLFTKRHEKYTLWKIQVCTCLPVTCQPTDIAEFRPAWLQDPDRLYGSIGGPCNDKAVGSSGGKEHPCLYAQRLPIDLGPSQPAIETPNQFRGV